MESNKHGSRINVAVSRAKGLALVFGAPRLCEAKCETVEQMRLVNTLCALDQEDELLQFSGSRNSQLTDHNLIFGKP